MNYLNLDSRLGGYWVANNNDFHEKVNDNGLTLAQALNGSVEYNIVPFSNLMSLMRYIVILYEKKWQRRAFFAKIKRCPGFDFVKR